MAWQNLLLVGLCLVGGVFTAELSPVVILPGAGGSQLEARLNKPQVRHWYCSRRSRQWYTLWISLPSLLPFAHECFVDNIKMVWNPETKTYSNNAGVDIRVPREDGSTKNFEYLLPWLPWLESSDYFHTLVEAMVKAGGIRNVTIRGFPYDFRRAPSSVSDRQLVPKLSRLIEDTYNLNRGKKVTILCHSMGCVHSLWFLTHKDLPWKEKYVRQWIVTSGPFAGVGAAVRRALSGDISTFPFPGLDSLTVREEQRSQEALFALWPNPKVWEQIPVVVTPRMTYTASDHSTLFEKSGFHDAAERYRHFLKDNDVEFSNPGVKTHNLYGSGLKTPTGYKYSTENFDKQPAVTLNGDGDNTVPLVSLQALRRHFTNNQTDQQQLQNLNHHSDSEEKIQMYREKLLYKRPHMDILKDPEYIQEVIRLLRT